MSETWSASAAPVPVTKTSADNLANLRLQRTNRIRPGTILISHPLSDDIWHRSIVYVTDLSEDGTEGVMVNRRVTSTPAIRSYFAQYSRPDTRGFRRHSRRKFSPRKRSEKMEKDAIDTMGDKDLWLKKNFLKKIFGYEARCEFWVNIGLRFWILVGYVDFLSKFGAKLSFRV